MLGTIMKNKVSISQPHELGFRADPCLNRMAKVGIWELGKPIAEGRRLRRSEIVPKPT